MPSILPLEIEEMIFDILGEDDKGHSTLKTCSLVCQAFLHICRRHIFESVSLNSSTIRASNFGRLLRETPEIADYIRQLDFTIGVAVLAIPSFQESLKRISRLKFLRVQPRHGISPTLNWSNNLIRPLLLHLLHLPTLTHFKVNNVNGFVVSDLIPCVNLKHLDIGLMTVAAKNTFPATLSEHSIQLNKLVAQTGAPSTIMKLCTVRRPDGHPIIDFGSLSNIKVDIDKPNEGEASQELFRHCHVLTNVRITCKYYLYCDHQDFELFASVLVRDPNNVRPSLADMLRPSMQTLKHIVLDLYNLYDFDVDLLPGFGIPSELEDVRNKNIIETIGISVTSIHWVRGNVRVFDWGRLDEVLTALGWFSLKRVSLTMRIHRYNSGGNESELDVALRNLQIRQFPRLSSSNSVSFNFKVTHVQ